MVGAGQGANPLAGHCRGLCAVHGARPCRGKRPGRRRARGRDVPPLRPVRVVGTNSPGGSPDILIRTIVSKLAEELGKPVVVATTPERYGEINKADYAC